MRRDSPDSGAADGCKENGALRILAEIENSFASLWRRHLSVQALKTDIIGIEGLTDEVKHLGPVREDDARSSQPGVEREGLVQVTF